MSQLTLQGGSPPTSPVVTTNAAIIELVVNYVAITGDETLTGLVMSATTPTVDQQGLVWMRTSAPIGLYYYSGGWTKLPVIIPSHTTALLPSSPYVGQIVWNTDRTPLGSLEIYRAGAWTNNFLARGPTADRPTNRPNGYRYYDTDISRWLHWNSTASAWTTDDGAVGDWKEIDPSVSEADALARNPGWEVVTTADGKFLIGASTTYGAGTTGGRTEFSWQVAKRGVDIGTGPPSGMVNELRIDGQTGTSPDPNSGSTSSFGDEYDVPILPPYLAILRIKKVVA